MRDGRVLGLIEDDERVIQCAAPHVGQRDHLHDVLFGEPLEVVVVHHLAERIHQRPEIGIDLGLQVAGEIAKALTGLDRRSDEDDLADLLGAKCRHRHGHGEKRLPTTGRARAEHDVVVADRLHVDRLAGRAGHELAARLVHLDWVVAGGRLRARRHSQQPHDHVTLHAAVVAGDPVEFLEDLGGAADS